jgi:uncharacterized protein YdaU (DUF1376 family)
MNKPPAFQFYAKSWLSSTRVMSVAARGAYMDLLAWSWDNGPLPKADKAKAGIVGVSESQFKRLWSEFSLKWTDTASGFVNARLEQQRSSLHAFRQSRSENGRKGAAKRWQDDGSAIDSPMASDSSASASTTTSTPPGDRHTPIARETNPHSKPTNLVNGGEQRLHGQHAWCSWPERDGLCIPAFLHREFVGKLAKPEADRELRAWYPTVIAQYAGQPIGDESIAFWRNHFASWVGTVTTKPGARRLSSAESNLRGLAEDMALLEGRRE